MARGWKARRIGVSRFRAVACPRRRTTTGHTWHHADEVLFGITSMASDMPAFGGVLTDREIRSVLAYIASNWSAEARKHRAQMLSNR